MAVFSITVPDDQVQTIAEAFAAQLGMPNQDQLTGQALLDAQVEFARQKCMTYINGVVLQYLQWKQAQAAPVIPDPPLTLT